MNVEHPPPAKPSDDNLEEWLLEDSSASLDFDTDDDESSAHADLQDGRRKVPANAVLREGVAPSVMLGPRTSSGSPTLGRNGLNY